VEGMIANPTAVVVAASADKELESASGNGGAGKTLTVNGSAADATTWNTLLNECNGMSSTLSNLVSMISNSETYTVTINLVNGEEGIFVDAFNGKKVDVKDLQDWDLNGCDSKTSRCQLFAHILQEYWHAAVTGDGYAPSHASAIEHENQVRSELGKTTTTTGHFGVRQGGNLFVQTPYGGTTELIQIIDGTNVGATTVKLTPPAAPSGLTADNSVSCRIILRWTDNSNNESGFSLERRTEPGGTWEQYFVGQIGPGVTTWENTGIPDDGTGLMVGVTYCYRIRAYRAVDSQFEYSAYSNEACATKQ